MHQPAANPGVAVGGNAHANARATDQNPKISPFFFNSRADGMRIVGVIDALRIVCAVIQDLMAGFNQSGGKPVFKTNTTMVSAQRQRKRARHMRPIS